MKNNSFDKVGFSNFIKNKFENLSFIDYTNGKVHLYCHVTDENSNDHGSFEKTPSHCRCGQGCPKCGKLKQLEYHKKTTYTTKEFIEKSKEIHNDKYDYSNTVYTKSSEKIKIICPIHGEFLQMPYSHLQGCGCPICGLKTKEKPNIEIKDKINKTDNFIIKGTEKHNNFYDYSQVIYINCDSKVTINCPIHGYFEQTPYKHLKGQGCPKCRYDKSAASNSLGNEKFIEKSNIIHNNKYDYSKVNYINRMSKVDIVCQKHGTFNMSPSNHLIGEGCPKCGRENTINSNKLNTEKFIMKAKTKHGDKYDYSKVGYINSITKICIICPIHGDFWQQPNNHLHGQGCPICKESKLELEVSKLLDDNGIICERQKHFEWLGRQSLDFYIESLLLAIECQGKQHFDLGGWCDEKELKLIKLRDKVKKELCEKHGIKLIYFSNLGIEYPYEVFENKKEILKIINQL